MTERDIKARQMEKMKLVCGLANLLKEQVEGSMRYGELSKWGCPYTGTKDGCTREQIKDTCKQMRLVLSKLSNLY